MRTNFTLIQGATFERVVRWYAPPFIYKPISAITQGAPVSISVAAHGIPDGWLAAVVAAKGMQEINADDTPPLLHQMKKATVVDVDTVEFNEVVSANYKPYTSGGFLVYYTPVNIGGFSARMTIKNRVGGDILFALVSPTHIAIDDVTKTITITIPAADTETFATGNYVYDLEAVDPTGAVTQLLSGAIAVVPEVTT